MESEPTHAPQVIGAPHLRPSAHSDGEASTSTHPLRKNLQRLRELYKSTVGLHELPPVRKKPSFHCTRPTDRMRMCCTWCTRLYSCQEPQDLPDVISQGEFAAGDEDRTVLMRACLCVLRRSHAEDVGRETANEIDE